jgi:hypothetical protein
MAINQIKRKSQQLTYSKGSFEKRIVILFPGPEYGSRWEEQFIKIDWVSFLDSGRAHLVEEANVFSDGGMGFECGNAFSVCIGL